MNAGLDQLMGWGCVDVVKMVAIFVHFDGFSVLPVEQDYYTEELNSEVERSTSLEGVAKYDFLYFHGEVGNLRWPTVDRILLL